MSGGLSLSSFFRKYGSVVNRGLSAYLDVYGMLELRMQSTSQYY